MGSVHGRPPLPPVLDPCSGVAEVPREAGTSAASSASGAPSRTTSVASCCCRVWPKLGGSNALLAEHLVCHNDRFAVPAQHASHLCRPQPRDLEPLFYFKFHRVVALDHTVCFRSQAIDIPKPSPTSLARAAVEVQQHFDGTVNLLHDGRCLATCVRDAPSVDPLRLANTTNPE